MFEDLPYYKPSYTFLAALGELLLIITIRVEHVTEQFRSALRLAVVSKVASAYPSYPSPQAAFFSPRPIFWDTHYKTRPKSIGRLERRQWERG